MEQIWDIPIIAGSSVGWCCPQGLSHRGFFRLSLLQENSFYTRQLSRPQGPEAQFPISYTYPRVQAGPGTSGTQVIPGKLTLLSNSLVNPKQ